MAKKRFYFLWFSLIIIAVFILQNLIPGFTELFLLSEDALVRPWQFLTAIFLHGSLVHLVYNLFALIIFGLILEQLIGSKRFLWLFLISGVLVNFISFWWYPNALGASGAIMVILGTLAILRPFMGVWAFGMIIPMFLAAAIWAVGAVMGVFGFGDQGIGHLAHLSGIILGLFYGLYLRISATKRKGIRFFKSRVKIPENTMRLWEANYMNRN